MGYLLLVEFDDEKQAQTMIRRFHKAAKLGRPLRMLGVFKTPEPKDMCTCVIASDTQRKNEVSRGAKYGWYMHKPCGKPRGPIHPLNLLPRMLGKVTTRDSWVQQGRAADATLYTRGDTGKPIDNFPVTIVRKENRR